VTDLLAALKEVQQLDAPALLMLAWLLFEVRRIKRAVATLPCKATPPAGGCPEVAKL